MTRTHLLLFLALFACKAPQSLVSNSNAAAEQSPSFGDEASGRKDTTALDGESADKGETTESSDPVADLGLDDAARTSKIDWEDLTEEEISKNNLVNANSEQTHTANIAGVEFQTTNSQEVQASGTVSTSGASGSASRTQTRSVDVGGVEVQTSSTRTVSGEVTTTNNSVAGGVVREQSRSIAIGDTEVETRRSDSATGQASVSGDTAAAGGSVTRERGGCVNGVCGSGSRTTSGSGSVSANSDGVAAQGDAERSYDGCLGSVCGGISRTWSGGGSVGSDGLRIDSQPEATVDIAGAEFGPRANPEMSINSNGTLSVSQQLTLDVGPVSVQTPRLSVGISGSGLHVGASGGNLESLTRTAVSAVDHQVQNAAGALRNTMTPANIASVLSDAYGHLGGFVSAMRSFGNSVARFFGIGGGGGGPPNIGQLAEAPFPSTRQEWLTMWQNRRNDHNAYVEMLTFRDFNPFGGNANRLESPVGQVSGSDCADFCPAMDHPNRFIVVNRTFLEASSNPRYGHIDAGNKQCCYPRHRSTLNFARDHDSSFLGVGGTTWYRGYTLQGQAIGSACVDNMGDCCRRCQSDLNCVATRYEENRSCPMGAAARSQSNGLMIPGDGPQTARDKGYCEWYSRVDRMATFGDPSNSYAYVAFPVVKDLAFEETNRFRGVPQWPTENVPVRDALWCPIGPRLAPNVFRGLTGGFCSYVGVHVSGTALDGSAYWDLNRAIRACADDSECAGVTETDVPHFGEAMYFANGSWVRNADVNGTVTLLRYPNREYPRVEMKGMSLMVRTGESDVAWRSPIVDPLEYPPPYTAVMEPGGNMVIYSRGPDFNTDRRDPDMDVIWSTDTAASTGRSHSLIMSQNGQLCVWSISNGSTEPVWCADDEVPSVRAYRLMRKGSVFHRYLRGARYWGKKNPRQMQTFGANVEWGIFGGFGEFASCRHDKAVVGMCSSGEREDCFSPGRNRREANVVGCSAAEREDNGQARLPQIWAGNETLVLPHRDDSTAGDAPGNRWHFDDMGQMLSCPSGMIMTGFCGSGRNRDCNNGRHQYQIQCRRFNSDAYRLSNCRTFSTRLWQESLQGRTWSDRVFEVMTGLCISGRQQDCRIGSGQPQAKIAKFCRLEVL